MTLGCSSDAEYHAAHDEALEDALVAYRFSGPPRRVEEAAVASLERRGYTVEADDEGVRTCCETFANGEVARWSLTFRSGPDGVAVDAAATLCEPHEVECAAEVSRISLTQTQRGATRYLALALLLDVLDTLDNRSAMQFRADAREAGLAASAEARTWLGVEWVPGGD